MEFLWILIRFYNVESGVLDGVVVNSCIFVVGCVLKYVMVDNVFC